jgi:hypothetical protein
MVGRARTFGIPRKGDQTQTNAMLAAYLSAFLKGAVTETGEQVDPAAVLQGLGLVFEGDHPT